LFVFNNVLTNIVKQLQKQVENKHCDYMHQVELPHIPGSYLLFFRYLDARIWTL